MKEGHIVEYAIKIIKWSIFNLLDINRLEFKNSSNKSIKCRIIEILSTVNENKLSGTSMQNQPNFKPNNINTIIFNMIIKYNAGAMKNISLISSYIVKLVKTEPKGTKIFLPNKTYSCIILNDIQSLLTV